MLIERIENLYHERLIVFVFLQLRLEMFRVKTFVNDGMIKKFPLHNLRMFLYAMLLIMISAALIGQFYSGFYIRRIYSTNLSPPAAEHRIGQKMGELVM